MGSPAMAAQAIAKAMFSPIIRTLCPYESYNKWLLHARVGTKAPIWAQKRENQFAFQP
jgi:hypothetical protein